MTDLVQDETLVPSEQPVTKNNIFGKFSAFLFGHPRRTSLIGIAIIAIAIPITIIAVLTTTNLKQYADKKTEDVQIVSEVQIALFNCSGPIVVGRECQISALAYGMKNEPIFKKVNYEWGISSVNSVGTLSKTRGNITVFYAKKIGKGDIWVIAKQGKTQVRKSIGIEVVAK